MIIMSKDYLNLSKEEVSALIKDANIVKYYEFSNELIDKSGIESRTNKKNIYNSYQIIRVMVKERLLSAIIKESMYIHHGDNVLKIRDMFSRKQQNTGSQDDKFFLNIGKLCLGSNYWLYK